MHWSLCGNNLKERKNSRREFRTLKFGWEYSNKTAEVARQLQTFSTINHFKANVKANIHPLSKQYQKLFRNKNKTTNQPGGL